MAFTFQVTFDAANPDALARFWAGVLQYQLQPPPEGFASWVAFLQDMQVPADRWDSASAIVDPEGRRPRLFFQKVPEGKTAKNRMHLDVNVSAGLPEEHRRARVDEEVQRVLHVGAARVQVYDERGEYWVVMHDPEGNEFCVQ